MNKTICGDCFDVMRELPDKSVDLVFTDPPYPKEFQYCYQYLADEAPRIMKDGASLMTIVGHYAIPDILKIFDGKLKYRWMMCMNQFNGSHARMAMGIEVTWKPILWFVKKAYPSGKGFLKDGIEIVGKDGQRKERHKWEQDISWAEYYITKLTNVGDIVLDPFAGSFTTAIACLNTNRNYICIEKDEGYCEIGRQRIEQWHKDQEGLRESSLF